MYTQGNEGRGETDMRYMISDAAKQVEVETHVLRYWEDELGINIARNEMGHRYYTKDDIDRFKEIHKMKENGYGLKAIKMMLRREQEAGSDNHNRVQTKQVDHLKDRRDEERYQRFDEILRMRQRKKRRLCQR